MSKIGFGKAAQEAKKIQEEVQAKNNQQEVSWLKIGDEPTQIRFITTDPEKCVVQYAEHFVQFNNNIYRGFQCADDGKETNTCKLCNLTVAKDGSADVKQNQYKVKFVMQVIERDAEVTDPDTKVVSVQDVVKAYKFTSFLMDGTLNKFYDDYGDIGDRDYKLSLVDNPDTASKLKKIYVMVPVSKNPRPLDEASQELLENIPDLESLIPPYDLEEINKLLKLKSKVVAKPTEAQQNVDDFLAATGITKLNSSSLLDDDEEEDLSALFTKVK